MQCDIKLPRPYKNKLFLLSLNGKDIIASAQTGTGKTAAFLLPLIHKLITSSTRCKPYQRTHHCPNTRTCHTNRKNNGSSFLFYFAKFNSLFMAEAMALYLLLKKKHYQRVMMLLVCTPGRMIAHLNMGYVKLDGLKYLVLDEADCMLDMGFNEDIMKIISYVPKQRQTLLFSATMHVKIKEMARRILNQPLEIDIAISKITGEADSTCICCL
jgi:superfamily II DNA/RNA helicase